MTKRAALIPGDVVQLKSGGPAMTLEGIFESGAALCVWFEGNAIIRRAFVHEALKHAENGAEQAWGNPPPLLLSNPLQAAARHPTKQ